MTNEQKLEAIREIIDALKDADYTEVDAGLESIERILNTF